MKDSMQSSFSGTPITNRGDNTVSSLPAYRRQAMTLGFGSYIMAYNFKRICTFESSIANPIIATAHPIEPPIANNWLASCL